MHKKKKSNLVCIKKNDTDFSYIDVLIVPEGEQKPNTVLVNVHVVKESFLREALKGDSIPDYKGYVLVEEVTAASSSTSSHETTDGTAEEYIDKPHAAETVVVVSQDTHLTEPQETLVGISQETIPDDSQVSSTSVESSFTSLVFGMIYPSPLMQEIHLVYSIKGLAAYKHSSMTVVMIITAGLPVSLRGCFG